MARHWTFEQAHKEFVEEQAKEQKRLKEISDRMQEVMRLPFVSAPVPVLVPVRVR